MNYKISTIILGVAVFALASIVVVQNWPTPQAQLTQTNTSGLPLGESSEINPSTYDPQNPPVRENLPESNSVDPKIIPWKLVKGDPTDTCTSPTYAGQATLKGRYVWDVSYANNQWLFETTSDYLRMLPLKELGLIEHYVDKPHFVLENISPELEQKLMDATSWEPAEVTITKVNQYCEGAATLTVK